MNIALLAAFWAVSMMFVATPGADWAYSISTGILDRAIPFAVAGLLLGHLVASVPYALAALMPVGAAYLLWLGVGLIRNSPVPGAGRDAGQIS